MTTSISRRNLTQGAAWAVPAITVASAAPAMAASSCAGIVKNQSLPVSAFTATYVCDTGEQAGGLLNKTVALDFGFRVSAAAQTCGVTGSITSVNAGGASRFTLSNGTTYSATNGLAVPAGGTVGSTDTSCQSGLAGTQACGTTGASPYNLTNSKSTSSYHVTALSLYREVTVSGYGTTILYINASGFGTSPGAGTADCATVLSITSSPLI